MNEELYMITADVILFFIVRYSEDPLALHSSKGIRDIKVYWKKEKKCWDIISAFAS